MPGRCWARLDAAQAAEAGWAPAALRRADGLLGAAGATAWLVAQGGRIVHASGPIERPADIHSLRKNVLSAVLGIQHARGRLRLEATLAELGIDDRQGLSERERLATVRDLLAARSGVYHPAARENERMRRDRPGRGRHAPGRHWYYNNWDFNALGSVLRRQCASSVFEGLQTDLVLPLGFEDFRAHLDTEWVREAVSEHPAYAMRLSVRDLARLGVLMARGGRWGARELLSSAWVDACARAWSPTPEGQAAFGWLWWTPASGFAGWTRRPGQVLYGHGNQGQWLWVDRVRDLVVVVGVHPRTGGVTPTVSMRTLVATMDAVFEALPGPLRACVGPRAAAQPGAGPRRGTLLDRTLQAPL